MVDVAVRRARSDDVAAAHAILAAWQEAVFGQAEMTAGMVANADAIADASYVAEGEDGIAGHASVRAESVNVLVAPSARRRGIGTALLRAAEAAAGADVLRMIGVTLEPAAAPFARVNGYEKASEVWLMGVDVADVAGDPAWPDGVSVRTFRDEDAPALKELLDLAYAEEDEEQLPYEDWRTFMLGDPSFDPEAWFLAVDGDRLVGAALNWDDGFVKDLVVHPGWRGRGLGAALMRRTFAEFAHRGIPRVTLKTDTVNPTQAWRLYERLGMRTERTYEVFEKRRR